MTPSGSAKGHPLFCQAQSEAHGQPSAMAVRKISFLKMDPCNEDQTFTLLNWIVGCICVKYRSVQWGRGGAGSRPEQCCVTGAVSPRAGSALSLKVKWLENIFYEIYYWIYRKPVI